MTQKEIIESYTKQQEIIKKIIVSMRNNDTEELLKYSSIMMLEIFKTHQLTDKKSKELIDRTIIDFLSNTETTYNINTLSLDEGEEYE